MSSKADVSAANQSVELARRHLVSFWEQTIDEEGSFDHVFGDPLATPCAVRIWVGYDNNDEINVDVIYPASNDAVANQEAELSNRDLKTIESVAYEVAHLLDTDIPRFAHTIYNHMSGLSSHNSFKDPLWNAWEEAKQNATSVSASYKKKLADDAVQLKQKQDEAVEKSKAKAAKKVLYRDYFRAQQEAARMAEWRNEERKRKLELERREAANIEREEARSLARIEAAVTKLYQSEPSLHRPKSNDEFSQYLERVYGLETHMVLYQNMGISNVPIPLIRFLTNVQEVNLSQNKLVVVPQEVFMMPSLKRLYLYSNSIRLMPPSFGDVAGQLEVLDLRDNQIVALPLDFGLLTKLQSLDLEKNKLRVLPDDIANLKDCLQHLNLANNLIKILPPLMGELHALRYLNLKRNPIVNLPPHIYLQGPGAAMKFLREQGPTAAGTFEPSSLTHDFANLPDLKDANGALLLADLVLQSNGDEASQPQQETSETSNEISNFGMTYQNGGLCVQVHSALVAARCPALATLLSAIKKQNLKLETHPSFGLPLVPLKLASEQLSILVKYLYSDQYVKPELPLISVSTTMTEEEVVETVKQNQISTQQFRDTLSRASSTASRFCLPHLQYLVDQHFKQAQVVESAYYSDIKRLWRPVVDFGAVFEVCPFDVSFSFPEHPEYEQLHAHKAVLCARSKFMRSMLTGGLMESRQRVVEIRDVHPGVFANIVEFCYTDDVEELNGETIMELMTAARMFALDRLLGIVESVVGYSLDVENVCGIMTTSALYALPKLSRACKFFVLSNWETVTSTPAWQETPEPIRKRLTKTALEWGVISS